MRKKSEFLGMDLGVAEQRMLAKSTLLNIDPYKHKAGVMFNIPYNSVTKEQRQAAKIEMYKELYCPHQQTSQEDFYHSNTCREKVNLNMQTQLLQPNPAHNGAIK